MEPGVSNVAVLGAGEVAVGLSYAVGVGSGALSGSSSLSEVSAVGFGAASGMARSSRTSCQGAMSGAMCENAVSCVMVGHRAGQEVRGCDSCVMVGSGAGVESSGASSVVALGPDSGRSTVGSSRCVAVGGHASLGSGCVGCVVVGDSSSASGDSSVVVGSDSAASGSRNVVVGTGWEAPEGTASCVFVGTGERPVSPPGASGAVVLGSSPSSGVRDGSVVVCPAGSSGKVVLEAWKEGLSLMGGRLSFEVSPDDSVGVSGGPLRVSVPLEVSSGELSVTSPGGARLRMTPGRVIMGDQALAELDQGGRAVVSCDVRCSRVSCDRLGTSGGGPVGLGSPLDFGGGLGISVSGSVVRASDVPGGSSAFLSPNETRLGQAGSGHALFVSGERIASVGDSVSVECDRIVSPAGVVSMERPGEIDLMGRPAFRLVDGSLVPAFDPPPASLPIAGSGGAVLVSEPVAGGISVAGGLEVSGGPGSDPPAFSVRASGGTTHVAVSGVRVMSSPSDGASPAVLTPGWVSIPDAPGTASSEADSACLGALSVETPLVVAPGQGGRPRLDAAAMASAAAWSMSPGGGVDALSLVEALVGAVRALEARLRSLESRL